MICRLEEKPDEGFSHLGDDFIWLECSNDKGPYGVVAIDIGKNGVAACHNHMKRWSPSVLKDFLIDWETIKDFCRGNGCKVLVVTTRNVQDTKWKKFVKRFGFIKQDLLLVSTQEI